jgi:fluoride exporter
VPKIPVIAAVAAGGALGAVARYALTQAWPTPPGTFDWPVWTINVTGCFLIGILMVLVARLWPDRRLLRPFWGPGFLGGYTTFSTATVDVLRIPPATALAYLGATLVGALLAVWLGTTLAEAMLRR